MSSANSRQLKFMGIQPLSASKKRMMRNNQDPFSNSQGYEKLMIQRFANDL